MDMRSFVGLFSYNASATQIDDRGLGKPESLEAEYFKVISVVGGTHHLIKYESEDFGRVLDNEQLCRFKWWEDRALSVAAFDAQKAKGIAQKG